MENDTVTVENELSPIREIRNQLKSIENAIAQLKIAKDEKCACRLERDTEGNKSIYSNYTYLFWMRSIKEFRPTGNPKRIRYVIMKKRVKLLRLLGFAGLPDLFTYSTVKMLF